MESKIVIHWFRRDLRIEDNAALYHALTSGKKVLCLFIFDIDILNRLEDKIDLRVEFIHQQLNRIDEELKKFNSRLIVKHDTVANAWNEVIKDFSIDTVYTNHDYEPYAILRDKNIKELLATNEIAFSTHKDQVIFEKGEVTKDDGLPYTIFTPYSKKWLARLTDDDLASYQIEKYTSNFLTFEDSVIPSLIDLGFHNSQKSFPNTNVSDKLLSKYADQRNFPGIEGTSHLGVHLRFGTVSIRKLAKHAKPISSVWLNELIWREFYMMILWHFPHVVENSFKPKYDRIHWRNNEAEFEKWKEGKTGYPIVDAGMRELNTTGFMHNRVRMIVASFLTKHLLVDWRWGEAYFAQKLLDFELSSNNGGWQWAAGSGCDAAPYFRIFNPYEQTKKFDADFKYIQKWVPEFQDFSYPPPLVDHKMARERCLATYSAALGSLANSEA
jgi:deoxyribodipyrimidine photo-lyase